ncbi:MAG: hypothetical protein Q9182_005122 [Xanthomendoza sp. 2 TL-2023]
MPSFFYHVAFDLRTPTDATRKRPLQSSVGDTCHTESVVIKTSSQTTTNATGATPDPSRSELGLPITDWRFDRIKILNIGMVPATIRNKRSSRGDSSNQGAGGIVAGHGGIATEGHFEPLNNEEEDIGWGVVRLFRDTEETPGLYHDPATSKSKGGRAPSRAGDDHHESSFRDEDCTTLCILAVPSYLTPSDFLGFVGEKTRDAVSHFRMVRTARGNRYMVLMRFRNGKTAREWRKEWDGKAFDSMEVSPSNISMPMEGPPLTRWMQPENCHVVFVKSIEFRVPDAAAQESFPDMSNDPFTPLTSTKDSQQPTAVSTSVTTLSSTARSIKPMAPPTPSLIELPTCPVCLERMDESTGLLTILCQHVFHCTCLQKWKGSGCPVCRYTQDGPSKRNTVAGEETGLNECRVCRSDANLWICLICGAVGCGRYDAAHAFLHYQQTDHCFAMDLSTQRIWDYASDAYVHRIVQDKADGKLMELPADAVDAHNKRYGGNAWDQEDYVPREKLDNIGLEYTHLLTSQLESQRTYFEEIVERAADKASQAAKLAETAQATATAGQEQLAAVQSSHEVLVQEIVPGLEKEKDRASQRASKFEAMARKLEKEWREEKAVSGSLMERIRWLEGQVQSLTAEKMDLQEQNRDLGFFISSGEKLKHLQGVEQDEVREGSTTVADPPAAGKGKKKGKK